jgi:hypothetical protein
MARIGSLSGIDRLAIIGFGQPIVAKPCLRERQGLERLRLKRLCVERSIKIRQSSLKLPIEDQLMPGKICVHSVRWTLLCRLKELGLGVVGPM